MRRQGTGVRVRAAAAAVVLLMLLALAARLLYLEAIPANITADEADNLQVIYRLLETGQPGFFGLDWKPAPAFSVYLMAGFMALFGDSIFGLRTASAFLSTLALVPFYFLARERLSPFASLAATSLLATSLWYLHFSRSGWENVHIALYGLTAAWMLGLALRRQRWYYYAGSGFWAALGLYGYYAGSAIILSLLAYLPVALWQHRQEWRRVLAGYGLMVVTCALLFYPQWRTIQEQWELAHRRIATVSVLQVPLPYRGMTDRTQILLDQAQRNLRGFFLLDGSVNNNPRYSPPGKPLLDFFAGTMFLLGLILGLRRWWQTALWWSMLLVPLGLTQVLSTNTPDASRAIGAAPFMYLFVGLGMEALVSLRLPWQRGLGRLVVAGAVPVVVFINLRDYADWMRQPAAAAARQPAVEVAEFRQWQRWQREAVKAGGYGFNVLEWQRLRARLSPPAAPVPIRPLPGATPVAGLGRFVSAFGGPGAGPGQFNGPRGLALDGQGHLYVADTGNRRVQKFGPQGEFMLAWGQPGRGEGEFAEPTAVAVDQAGDVFVLDSLTQAIQRFDPSGRFLARWGEGLGFYRPRGLHIDAGGNLFVADTGRQRIVVLSPQGRVAHIWGAGGLPVSLNQPTQALVDPEGNIYIAEPQQKRIQRLDREGRYPLQWPIAAMDTANGPHMAWGPGRLVLVSDPHNHQVNAFTPEGVLVGYWGRPGAGQGEFNLPLGLAADAQGHVYVADSRNNRVQKFRLGP